MLWIRVLSYSLLTTGLAIAQDAAPPAKPDCVRALHDYAAATKGAGESAIEAEIELLDVFDRVATAKITWPKRIEFLHLGRAGDGWTVLDGAAEERDDEAASKAWPTNFFPARRAVFDYVDAFYQAKPDLLDRGVHPKLAKYEVRGDSVAPMSFEALRQLAAGADPDGTPSFARRQVEILDVTDRTAVARLEGSWGIDFLLLTKTDDAWKTRHVVWQRYPSEPLRIEDAINDVCPVSGKAVSADALTRQAGQVVGFCCPDCPAKLAAAGADGLRRFEKQLEAENWDAPVPVRAPADKTRMVQLPDGTFLPALNGAVSPPAIAFRDRPFTPITGVKVDSSGREWYEHADGSFSTTVMGWRRDLGRWDAMTQVAHPTEPPAEDPWVEYRGTEGPGLGKHIVLISGDEEYRSEEALPQLGKILAAHHGFRCTVLFAVDPEDGTINPDVNDNIPGLEALGDADLMVIATRFRNLPDEQMKHIDAYLESGRPVFGMRTATHAFKIPEDRTYARYDFRSKTWDGGFGRQVLGETWINHHGHHGRQSTRGVPAEGRADHPILRGIDPDSIWGPTDVYGVRLPLPDRCEPVVMGQVLAGMEPDDQPVVGEKNDPMMPVAWISTYEAGDGTTGRVFTTTMGAATDLVAEGTRRMLVNACYWALGMEDRIPERSEVAIVGTYEPTAFGFKKFEKDVKPAAHRMSEPK